MRNSVIESERTFRRKPCQVKKQEDVLEVTISSPDRILFDKTYIMFDISKPNFDELAKTMFSRKDAKNAKKICFVIDGLPLRTLRLCVRFWLFTNSSTLLSNLYMSFLTA